MYVVLRRDPTGHWEEMGRTESKTSQGAIRKIVMDSRVSDDRVEYVAVPAKSWRPITVAVTTVTQLTLDGGEDKLPRKVQELSESGREEIERMAKGTI